MSKFASFNAMKPSFLQNASRCVFVGDLSFFCTELDLAEAFKQCGPISRLEVKRGRHGDSLLYAFVEFHSEMSAQIAIREMNNIKFMGRTMKVNWTDTKLPRSPGADAWVQVHVNFLCADLNMKISEEFLESVFIQYGMIGDIIVKRHGCSNAPAVVSGYAFIYFYDAYAAFRAIHGCKGISVEGVHFECALSRQHENILPQFGVSPKTNHKQLSPMQIPGASPRPLYNNYTPQQQQQQQQQLLQQQSQGKISPTSAYQSQVGNRSHQQQSMMHNGRSLAALTAERNTSGDGYHYGSSSSTPTSFPRGPQQINGFNNHHNHNTSSSDSHSPLSGSSAAQQQLMYQQHQQQQQQRKLPSKDLTNFGLKPAQSSYNIFAGVDAFSQQSSQQHLTSNFSPLYSEVSAFGDFADSQSHSSTTSMDFAAQSYPPSQRLSLASPSSFLNRDSLEDIGSGGILQFNPYHQGLSPFAQQPSNQTSSSAASSARPSLSDIVFAP